MSAFPYMRFFVGDYLGDTRHLSTTEHGAYLLLICAYWQSGEPLPNNDARLRRIAGVTGHQWAKMKPHIMAFFESRDAKIVHPRIEKEMHHMLSKSLKAKGAGRTSAQRRLNKRPTNPEPVPEEDMSAKADNAREDARQSGLPLDEPPGGGNAQEDLQVQFTAAFEHWWAAYPNKVGKGKAASAYQAAFKKLGGQNAGTERVHAHLFKALTAQLSVWRRKGIHGKYIPHPTTWLNQSRWEDGEVVKLLNPAPAVDIKVNTDGLSPATPKPERKATLERAGPVGWTPDDEES